MSPGDANQILAAAVQYHQGGRFAQAAEIYRVLLESLPDSPQLCNLYGLALHSLGQIDTALSFLRKAARLSPVTAKFHYDLGVILQLESRFEQAIEAYRKAVALQPDNGDAWENLGIACLDLASFADATEALDRAIKLKPDCANVLTNSAMLQRWLGRHDEAMRLYQAALEKEPTHLLARVKRAGVLLACGDFERGWREYAWRLTSAGQPEQDKVHYVPKPMWDGQPLNGRKLLVYTEQGIGDEVMFAAFLPWLKEFGGECHLLCDPRMVSIYRRSFPGLQVSAAGPGDWGTTAEECRCDVRVPIGNLAQHFCRSPQEITGQPYLKPDPDLVKFWVDRLRQTGGRLKVGISWRGGAQTSARRARSVTLDAFTPLLELDDVTFVNLQYGDCRKDIARLPKRLKKRLVCFSDMDPLSDLDSFCALMANLDLVITIDNSTVHFAGALGVPAWLLLPALADWRWPVTGEESRWYASVRLFRNADGDAAGWRSLIASLVDPVKNLEPRRVEPSMVESVDSVPQHRCAPASESSPGRVLFLNDTSFWYHWGCTCTSLAIRSMLEAQGWQVRGVPIDFLRKLPSPPVAPGDWSEDFCRHFWDSCPELREAIEQADAVVVNGEGSLHGGSDLARTLLFLMHRGKTELGRPVHVINHSCYPDDSPQPTGSELEALYRQVYAELDTIAVREPVSASLMETLGLQIVRSFDCLPLYVDRCRDDIVREEPRELVLAGSVAWKGEMLEALCALVERLGIERCFFLYGAAAHPAADDHLAATQLKQALGDRFELIHATSERQWLATIASAKLFVSGRFHHSIAAAFLGTPFIVMESNTPKIQGLMSMLGLDVHVDSSRDDAAERLIDLAARLRQHPESALLTDETRRQLLQRAQKNFDHLRAGT